MAKILRFETKEQRTKNSKNPLKTQKAHPVEGEPIPPEFNQEAFVTSIKESFSEEELDALRAELDALAGDSDE